MGKAQYSTEQFIKAIPGTGGIVSTLAKRIGCDWKTARKYIEEHPTVKQAYDNECEAVLDMAEGVLLKNITAGDSQDAKWYLSRKGKGRGYVERHELDVSGLLGLDIGQLSDEELDKLDREL